MPGSFVLAQNYPNPFNPLTRINFAISQTCRAKLEVFNILGQRVARLVAATWRLAITTLTGMAAVSPVAYIFIA